MIPVPMVPIGAYLVAEIPSPDAAYRAFHVRRDGETIEPERTVLMRKANASRWEGRALWTCGCFRHTDLFPCPHVQSVVTFCTPNDGPAAA